MAKVWQVSEGHPAFVWRYTHLTVVTSHFRSYWDLSAGSIDEVVNKVIWPFEIMESVGFFDRK